MNYFQFAVSLINSKPEGSTLSKADIRAAFMAEYGVLTGLTSVMSRLVAFIYTGELQKSLKDTDTYIIVSHVDENIRLSDIDEAIKRRTPRMQTIINKGEDEPYSLLNVSLLKTIKNCGLSYIQGSILKAITLYELSDDVEYLKTAKRYAELGELLCENTPMFATRTEMLYDFCTANEFSVFSSTAIRDAAQSSYKNVSTDIHNYLETL